MVLKTNTGWLVPEMCSDASKLLALIGKKNVGAHQKITDNQKKSYLELMILVLF